MAQKIDPTRVPRPPTSPVKAAGQKTPENAAPPSESSPLRWFMGWVLLPGMVVAGIFGAGVLVGAHFSDLWLTRAIVWFVGLFVAA